MESLNEAFNNIRGATMIVFPQGLPEWEPVQEIFDGCESDLERSAASKDIFEVNDTNLWWANKCLNGNGAAGAGKLLSDFLGKNEKSKVIVKMQKVD